MPKLKRLTKKSQEAAVPAAKVKVTKPVKKPVEVAAPAAKAPADQTEVLSQIREHALENVASTRYDWKKLVEVMTDADIVAVIGTTKSLAKALIPLRAALPAPKQVEAAQDDEQAEAA